MPTHKRAMLIILDGWGHSPDPAVSAIAQANTPFVDSLYKKYANSELVTHGPDVGLPDGQMGNSEVGHLNIGAGRVVYQELARINNAIASGELATNPVLNDAINKANAQKGSIHLMGLLSDGGVHSHIRHLEALCDILNEKASVPVFIHAFTDGRDVDPRSGLGFVREIEEYCRGTNCRLATIVGRYYAMDRDQRWARTALAYEMLVNGSGQLATDPVNAVQQSYDQGITDEFIRPIVTAEGDRPLTTIREGDTVLFFNFRTDRPRQLVRVLSQQAFPGEGMTPLDLQMVTMTSYDDTFRDIKVLFETENLSQTLGEYLSSLGMTQLRIAETEKYPHVTFFFSGGREEPFAGENRIMVPSPKVATYDLQPEMSALEVTDAVMADIRDNQPGFICLNYANTDMVGHTGVFSAAVKAAETVDACLSRLIPLALDYDYGIVIIADHGNSDTMVNPDGSPHTAHTKNPVPVIYVSDKDRVMKVNAGRLADIAPTILAILDIDQPASMTGKNLLQRG